MKKNNVYKFNKENELELKILVNDPKLFKLLMKYLKKNKNNFLPIFSYWDRFFEFSNKSNR